MDKKRRGLSLRVKLVLFSVIVNVALGATLGVSWLYYEAGVVTREATFDNRNRNREIQSILRDEFREAHRPQDAARHIGRAYARDSQIIRIEITDPNGLVLAAKPARLTGRQSAETREIRESVKLDRTQTKFWALAAPGKLGGRRPVNGFNPFSGWPIVQELVAPIDVNGRPVLVLHIYLSLARLTASFNRLISLATLITLFMAVAGGLITYFILDRLVYQPILALDNAAERIASGETGLRAPVVRRDEFGELADRFNRMTESLVQAQMQADTDGLTGLFNYRHLNNYLSSQIVQAERYHRPLSVAMLDIDHFKEVNDIAGHQAGDKLLRATADFLKSQLREIDYLARYGGEEFVIVMPQTGGQTAMKAMARVRAAFPKHLFVQKENARKPIFISIGVADYPACGTDTLNLLAAADLALMLSKRQGRNLVTYFSETGQKKAG